MNVGDWIEEPALDGGPPRHGLIVEVLGEGAHRHYRVRWDERHEALHYPSERARLWDGHGPAFGPKRL